MTESNWFSRVNEIENLCLSSLDTLRMYSVHKRVCECDCVRASACFIHFTDQNQT